MCGSLNLRAAAACAMLGGGSYTQHLTWAQQAKFPSYPGCGDHDCLCSPTIGPL